MRSQHRSDHPELRARPGYAGPISVFAAALGLKTVGEIHRTLPWPSDLA